MNRFRFILETGAVIGLRGFEVGTKKKGYITILLPSGKLLGSAPMNG